MKKEQTFAIIGVGNLGKYYLKSLANYSGKALIQIIDASQEALDRAKSMFEESNENKNVRLEICQDISELNEHIDILAVVTSSRSRRRIVEMVLETKEVQYMILEKVLFPCLEDYDAIKELLEEKSKSMGKLYKMIDARVCKN